MSPEYYRHRAEECCRNSIRAEDIERRLHWQRYLLLAMAWQLPVRPWAELVQSLA